MTTEILESITVLKGIRRRLTFIAFGVVAIALIDGLFFVAHPGNPEYHECEVD